MQIQDKVVHAVLKLIACQRNGDSIDSSLVKKIVESFVSLGMDDADAKKSTLDLYKKYFETPFINATRTYYQAASESFISANSVPEYLIKVIALILGLKLVG
jgi:cullin 1